MSAPLNFLFGFIAIFTVLYSMWYFSGGPLKESSDRAFIKGPDSSVPFAPSETYGTIYSVDKINRQINP